MEEPKTEVAVFGGGSPHQYPSGMVRGRAFSKNNQASCLIF